MSTRRSDKKETTLLFGKQNYLFIGLGLGIVILGFILMSGGSMPDPDTWDPNLIYSTRRITVAPFVVLLGLAVIGYALFRKSPGTLQDGGEATETSEHKEV